MRGSPPTTRRRRPMLTHPVPRRLHFDVRLLQRVPYEGVSRMQTSLRRRHRDRVVRCARASPTPRITLLTTQTLTVPLRAQPRHRHDHRGTGCRKHLPPPPALTPSPCSQSDFYATEAGRQHFRDQLTSIRYWSARCPFPVPCPAPTSRLLTPCSFCCAASRRRVTS